MRVTPAQVLFRPLGAVACFIPSLVPLALALGLAVGWRGPADSPTMWLRIVALWAVCALATDGSLRNRCRRLIRPSPAGLGCIGGLLITGAAMAVVTWPADALPHPLFLGLGLLTPVARRVFVRAARTSRSVRGEALRWILVGGTAVYAIHPYATRGLVGLGDALFYTQQLNDITSQARAGRFPAFVGESAYSPIGDIHPLRTAPYFQHVGLAASFATGNRLGAAGVQNLLIVGSLVLAAAFTYLLGLRLGGRKSAWLACFLALAVATSPGVLSLVYSGDLIASWMTLP